jgi:hypothetical protein
MRTERGNTHTVHLWALQTDVLLRYTGVRNPSHALPPACVRNSLIWLTSLTARQMWSKRGVNAVAEEGTASPGCPATESSLSFSPHVAKRAGRFLSNAC